MLPLEYIKAYPNILNQRQLHSISRIKQSILTLNLILLLIVNFVVTSYL